MQHEEKGTPEERQRKFQRMKIRFSFLVFVASNAHIYGYKL